MCIGFQNAWAIDASVTKPEYDYYLESPTPNIKSRKQMMSMLPKGGVGVELGVFWGDFSHVILREAQPRKLYLVDCFENQPREVYDDNIADKSNHVDLYNAFLELSEMTQE